MESGRGQEDAFDAESYNINGSLFHPELYLQKLLKEAPLSHLMKKEKEIFRQIQELDSEMQTLVYENYNKFISATDTIRKMKTDFKKMEDEMENLKEKMKNISMSSDQVSSTLQDRRHQIHELSGTHSMLQRLQFLFNLPTEMKKLMNNGEEAKAVEDYLQAQQFLCQYEQMTSFHSIHNETEAIVQELKTSLRKKFTQKDASPQGLSESIDLLLRLGEPPDTLCSLFLESSGIHLVNTLETLERQSQNCDGNQSGYVEFMDAGCNGFIGDLCLLVAAYNDSFIIRYRQLRSDSGNAIALAAVERLLSYTNALMNRYLKSVEDRSLEEAKKASSFEGLVQGLDKFLRRLHGISQLLPGTDFGRTGTELIGRVAKVCCEASLQRLKDDFERQLMNSSEALQSPKLVAQEKDLGSGMNEAVNLMLSCIASHMKATLLSLQALVAPDVTFATKSYFRQSFANDGVRETVIVGFFQYVCETAKEFCEGHRSGKVFPPLLLILSRVCLDLEKSTVHYFFTMIDEIFGVTVTDKRHQNDRSSLCQALKAAAQSLVDHYTMLQGVALSQMIRKSMETRNWLQSNEPRNVRPVMKRIVEDISAMETHVGALFEEGPRKERSSDSSRRAYSQFSRTQNKSAWPSYPPHQLDRSFLTNLHRLFSDRVDIHSSVDFNKISILTGIIKVLLKAFLECVRLKTYGKFGVQQIQVDAHYLQIYLWRFVSDENLVHNLLDEVLSSAYHRCVEPVLMDSSIVESICQKN
ncbi:unnamed protein product [Darwinula stevensoni]|uniref:Vacuolar protein sorting-associated protein 51 homolog n=1 Tax=Darwinula stevensoni TaxID=69355 RepID=A0A7R9FQV5_9CRUS|nr:unnamed protein product [Darwinula stevensoni]CAG0900241.1 unnamed protein product [Darwinula stevensoni]